MKLSVNKRTGFGALRNISSISVVKYITDKTFGEICLFTFPLRVIVLKLIPIPQPEDIGWLASAKGSIICYFERLLINILNCLTVT